MKYHTYAKRRARFGRLLGEGVVALIPGAANIARNADVEFSFRQDSDFLYLTGFDEPDALLVVVGGKPHHSILFSLPKDHFAELWNGERVGQERAGREYGFQETYALESKETTEALIRRLRFGLSQGESAELILERVRTQTAHNEVANTLLRRLLSEAWCVAYPKDRFAQVKNFIEAHERTMKRTLTVIETRRIIGEMRLIKNSDEIAIMQRAANVSAQAHRDILSFVRPGMHEYDVEAVLSCAFRRGGGDRLHAYTPIVASGKNACTLHYTKNNALLRNGELLLIDAGCEISGYASDITRTFPIGGIWSKEQRELYDIVHLAQLEAIKHARVGTPLEFLNDVARRIIAEGLLRLGLITAKDVDDALARGLDKLFMPHGTSHWLGGDVHDSGDYELDTANRKARRLEAGMVITIEPGIYVRPSPYVHPKYWNIGIRIEDDVLITKDGPIVLSHLAPKDPEEIEAVMHSEMT